MEHVYEIPNVTYVAEKGDHEKVAVSAQVYLTTKETFNHTFETETYIDAESSATTETVTEEKTVDHFQQFTVNFDTSSLDPSSFTAWDDLTEEQVITWAKAATDVTDLETKGADIVTEKKDKILNPNKYLYDTPATPWRVRADAAARAAAEETTEETN